MLFILRNDIPLIRDYKILKWTECIEVKIGKLNNGNTNIEVYLSFMYLKMESVFDSGFT